MIGSMSSGSDIVGLTKTAVVKSAEALLPKFTEVISSIPPEAGYGGVWESEMFLFCAAVTPFQPRQLLESVRALGKSKLILARGFPEARIISVVLDRGADDA